MRNLVSSYENNGKVLEIYFDSSPQNPRNWDNLGTMVCLHRRYSLGDEHDYKSSHFSSWEEVRKAIERDNDVAVILPIYLYDHSGLVLSTAPFHCPWDSGQVGWVYVTKEKLREEYGVKYVTKKIREIAVEVLNGELDVYSEYITGNVFGYVLKDEDEKEIESIWGFYGTDFSANGLAAHAGTEWKQFL